MDQRLMGQMRKMPALRYRNQLSLRIDQLTLQPNTLVQWTWDITHASYNLHWAPNSVNILLREIHPIVCLPLKFPEISLPRHDQQRSSRPLGGFGLHTQKLDKLLIGIVADFWYYFESHIIKNHFPCFQIFFASDFFRQWKIPSPRRVGIDELETSEILFHLQCHMHGNNPTDRVSDDVKFLTLKNLMHEFQ